MKTRKNKIIVLAASFLLIHFSLIYVFDFLAARNNELVRRFDSYKKNDPEIRLLFLGDSHVERGVDVSAIDGATSLAYYGENNIMCYYRLKYCLENDLPKPEYVVLPCDIFSFAKGINEHRTRKFFYYSFISFSDLKDFESRQLYSTYEYLRLKLFPYSEMSAVLVAPDKKKQAKAKLKYSSFPEFKRKKMVTNLIQNELQCAQDKQNLFYTGSLMYIQKTIDLCKKNKIKLIYIRYPMTQDILNEIRSVDSAFIKNRPSEKIIRDNGIPILDFEAQFQTNYDLFFDSHHLNEAGKQALSPLLKERLDSLLKNY